MCAASSGYRKTFSILIFVCEGSHLVKRPTNIASGEAESRNKRQPAAPPRDARMCGSQEQPDTNWPQEPLRARGEAVPSMRQPERLDGGEKLHAAGEE